MLVITAEKLPHDTGTVLSEALDDCVSRIVFAGTPPIDGHWKPDPVHSVVTTAKAELKAHV